MLSLNFKQSKIYKKPGPKTRYSRQIISDKICCRRLRRSEMTLFLSRKNRV